MDNITTTVPVTTSPHGYVDGTTIAKIIKTGLAKRFPGVKFSAKTSKYSGGSSVRVGWTDGPTRRMAEALYGHLHLYDFDGMTDSTVYRGPVSINGVSVRPGNSYLFFEREVSPALKAKAKAFAERKYGAPVDDFGPYSTYNVASRATLGPTGVLTVYPEYADFSPKPATAPLPDPANDEPASNVVAFPAAEGVH